MASLQRALRWRALPQAARALGGARRGYADGVEYHVPKAAIEQFREDGYCSLQGFLTEAELAPIEKLYDAFMRGEIMTKETHGKDFCDMSQPFDTPFEKFQLINAMLPTRYSYAMKYASAIYEARCASVSRQLFPGVRMLLDYDQLLNKKPNKKKAVFAWHQDMAYWPSTPDTRTATFSLALDATTAQNGALKFLKGSGKAQTIYPHKPVGKGRDDSHAIAVEVDEEGKDKDRVVLVPIARGDVSVHDEWVVHGSGGNLSDGPRRTFVMAFRTEDTIRRERMAGFSHSHTDAVNWDSFDKFDIGHDGKVGGN